MRRFAFSALVLGVLVACGGANSTDLFSGNGTAGGGGTNDGGTSTADGSTPVNNNDDAGNAGTNDDAGNPGVDSGKPGKDAGTTGTKCTVDGGGTSNTCASDEVCLSANCSTGTCQKINVGANDYNPVCGCDSVNYWNAATASSFAAAVKSGGVCANPATCNGGPPGNPKCSALQAADCALEKPDVGSTTCGLANKNPVCWGMPDTCPAKPTSGVSLCSNGACADLCTSIKSQTPYRVTVPACKIM